MPSIRDSEPGPRVSILRVEDLDIEFSTDHGPVSAVRGVSLTVGNGRVVGLVGESGSGKSATALAVLGLLHARGRIRSGRVLLGDIDLRAATERDLQRLRGRRMSLVPQDPMSALNPGLRIGAQLGMALRAHRGERGARARASAVELCAHVHLPDPEHVVSRYPHELSGGQRQRVVLALALAGEPELLIADEATTALDVTTQRQVLDLLRERNAATGLSIMLITHDLGVVANMCDDVYVMRAGRVVEEGFVAEVLRRPQHPYTADLIESFPDPARRNQPLGRHRGSDPEVIWP